uniref:Uncharacterized protein n=1 Tax=mine drainage metagenome TaxID=410659 RepID=E6Q306_9ZZZZ
MQDFREWQSDQTKGSGSDALLSVAS